MVVPAYAIDYQGIWACINTESFSYKDGKYHKSTADKKFLLKIKEDMASLDGKKLKILDDSQFPPVMALEMENNLFKFKPKSRKNLIMQPLIAVDHNRFFRFTGKAYTDISIYSEFGIYTFIGTCEKFDAPE